MKDNEKELIPGPKQDKLSLDWEAEQNRSELVDIVSTTELPTEVFDDAVSESVPANDETLLVEEEIDLESELEAAFGGEESPVVPESETEEDSIETNAVEREENITSEKTATKVLLRRKSSSKEDVINQPAEVESEDSSEEDELSELESINEILAADDALITRVDDPIMTKSEPFVSEEGGFQIPKSVKLEKSGELANTNHSIGQALKFARKGNGFSPEDVAERTKINRAIIINLECDNWSELPAPIYTRSHIRKLSSCYSLEAEVMVERYNEMINKDRCKKPIDNSSQVRKLNEESLSHGLNVSQEKGRGFMVKLLLFIVIIGLLYTLYIFFNQDKGDTVESTPDTSQVEKDGLGVEKIIELCRPEDVKTLKIELPE